MKVTGKITKVLDTQKGTSAAGKDWQKLSFILETTEDYNNLYCFDVFGDEKVEQFLKYNKDVNFNVQTNEYKGKYYTSLQSWKIFKAEAGEETASEVAQEEEDDLPF
jgi:hypothetical protein